METGKQHLNEWIRNFRPLLCLLAILLAVAMKGTTLVEIQLVEQIGCPPMTARIVMPHSLGYVHDMFKDNARHVRAILRNRTQTNLCSSSSLFFLSCLSSTWTPLSCAVCSERSGVHVSSRRRAASGCYWHFRSVMKWNTLVSDHQSDAHRHVHVYCYGRLVLSCSVFIAPTFAYASKWWLALIL